MTEWVSVFSSGIRKIAYDANTKKMYIDFEDSDSPCTYCNVPQELYYQLVSASSVSFFYDQHIKDKYDC